MKRWIASLLALALLLPAGCGAPEQATSRSAWKENEPPDQKVPASTRLLQDQPETVSYPLEDVPVLTAILPGNYGTKQDDMPFYQSLKAQTGISVQYRFVGTSDYQSHMVSSLAADDLPDLIWGLERAMTEALQEELLELTDGISSWAPNYVNTLRRQPAAVRSAVEDSGEIYQFVTVWEEPTLTAGFGPVVRQDLLDRYALELPVTYEDWEAVLEALMDQVEQPLLLDYNAYAVGNYFCAGYGVSAAFNSTDRGFYQVDGTVKYGMLEPEFSQWIDRMADWYRRRLIGGASLDFPDITTSDYLLRQANGESAVFFLPYDKLDALMEVSEVGGFAVSLLPDPVKEAGDQTHLAQAWADPVVNRSFSISADCDEPEAAVRYVDYLYSPEGVALCNLGTEGVTWQRQGEDAVFTDAALEDPALLNQHTNCNLAGVYTRQRFQQDSDPALLAASEIWTDHRDTSYHLPFDLRELDAEEYPDLLTMVAEITAYAESMTLQLLIGEKALDELPAMQEELKALGLDRCVDMLQACLDQYLAR